MNLTNCISVHTETHIRRKSISTIINTDLLHFQLIQMILTSGKSNFIVSFSVCCCARTIPKILIDRFTRIIYDTNVVANSISAIPNLVGGNDAEN